jgi:hypothetical protein
MPFKILTLEFDSSLNGFDQEVLDQFCVNKRIYSLYLACKSDWSI